MGGKKKTVLKCWNVDCKTSRCIKFNHESSKWRKMKQHNSCKLYFFAIVCKRNHEGEMTLNVSGQTLLCKEIMSSQTLL